MTEKHYSGELSEEFWNEVNSLKEPQRTELYACGVLLQNMESTILLWLGEAKKYHKLKKSSKARERKKCLSS